MISFAIDKTIATITLCHPPANAINEEWLDRLDSALEKLKPIPPSTSCGSAVAKKCSVPAPTSN